MISQPIGFCSLFTAWTSMSTTLAQHTEFCVNNKKKHHVEEQAKERKCKMFFFSNKMFKIYAHG